MKLFPALTESEVDALFAGAICGEPVPQIVMHKPTSYVPPVDRGHLIVGESVVAYARPNVKGTPSSRAKAALMRYIKSQS